MGPGMTIFPAIERPHVSLAAEKLFDLGPIPFTNAMLTMFLVMAGLVLFFLSATRRLRAAGDGGTGLTEAPRGAQNFAEFVVEALLNLVEGTIGKATGRRIFPLIATLFLFILTSNYAGLLPGVGSIGFVRHAAEEHAAPVEVMSAAGVAAAPATTAQQEVTSGCRVAAFGIEFARGSIFCSPDTPLFRAPNADLNMTIAMALIAVVTVQIVGVTANGAGTYFKEFLNPIHLVGELSRIVSLAARLFGNIFGGEVLLAVIIALTAAALGLFGIIPAIFYGLELFFGFIQALLFSLLTLIYITVAAAGHGDHGHADHEEADDYGHGENVARAGAVGD